MKFNITSNALKLMVYLYKNCNTNFQVKNLKITNLFDSDTTKDDIAFACKYLCEKRYIKSGTVFTEIAECDITPLGIEWVEECHKNGMI